MNNIISVAKNVGLKAATKIKKASPGILLGIGAAGIVGGIVLACIETRKIDEIIEDHLEIRDIIENTEINNDPESGKYYSEKDRKTDIAKLYFITGKRFVKNYAPAIGVIATSMFCIFASYGIMRKRNATLVAAYNVIQQAFGEYRDRVREAVGEDKERDIYYGVKDQSIEVTTTDEEGKESTKKSKQKILPDDPNNISPYAKFFDEMNPNWCKNPEYNLNFLKTAQNYCNDMFNSRGHLFLNEVYDQLGIPRTQTGAVVGWVKGAGDDCVDFGIYNGYRAACRDFVNGYERSILLDFNVDGVIFDKI